ncbi:MAG TPA: bifunctional diguanylate cyclase/phosphodiesterase, partial [Rhodospirillaceae bacterium]|nr:bifunctional diguanylate cyclase/phosphodiesterase [Rhodospirillaceae bacterium]
DTLGHSIGDRLLQAVAERLSDHGSHDRFICRLGGDEFVLGVRQCQEAGALAAAAEIERSFTRPFSVQQMELSVSTSIGVAIDEGLSRDPLDLLRDADIALYRAKEHGQAQIEVFSAELRDAILIRHRLEHDLARAIAAGEIFLVYQPIVSLSDNRLIGFESLVRWRHPDLGLISPVKFIPIAEETGQILPLGRFILGEAAKASAAWRDRFPAAAGLSVNVNLSPRQMWNEDYMEEIIGFLQTLPPGSLKIEVTEGMTISNPEMAEVLLQRFHQIGVPLCIDDFGTGYSSLAYLHRFPFDVLKIDKSFVTGIETSPAQCRLVRGMINLAHELGMVVVAEGIESEAENQQLKDLNCDFAQGYLFARPLPYDEATAYLLRQ